MSDLNPMDDLITIEIKRSGWIALVAAAFYGSNALESDIGGHVAGTADGMIEELKTKLGIYSIRDEATKIEVEATRAERRDLRKPGTTPSA